MENNIRLTKFVTNFVIQGINSSSVTKDSFYAEFELHVGSRFIKVMALVSDSSLFDSSRDILLGEDVLHRCKGTVIPCDREIIWWAREDEPYKVLDLLERTYGRRNVDIFHRGGV